MRYSIYILLGALMLAVVPATKAQVLDIGPPDTSVCGTTIVLDAGAGFTSYSWSTGDTVQVVTLNNDGPYSVTVVDNQANTQVDSIIVFFLEEPTALFVADNVCIDDSIPMSNRSLVPVGDSLVAFSWDFGDGNASNLFEPKHAYTTVGIKTIELIITSSNGCTDTATGLAEIYPLPTVDAGRDTIINVGQSVQLDGFVSEGTPAWTPDLFLSADSIINPVATPVNSITYTLTTADTTNGCTNIDEVTISVNNAPVAQDDQAVAVPNGNISIAVTNNDFEPDGNPFSITIVSGPFHGTASVIGADSISYTPDPNYTGDDTLVYQVCDNFTPPLCDVATVIIIVPNLTPVAEDDAFETGVNQSITFNVLDNDTEPNGEQVFITEVSSPENGTIVDLGSGDFTYTPDADYSGDDVFFYILCDNGTPILCDTAFVTITTGRTELFLHNSFTPNGDGQFDTFIIEGINSYPDNELIVFDRWGDIVFKASGYLNTWDGTSEFSEEVPDGTYFYRLDLKNNEPPLSGYVVIKR